jgi:hypothetical protein
VFGDGIQPFASVICRFDAEASPHVPEAAQFRKSLEEHAAQNGWHNGDVVQLVRARQTEDAAETKRFLDLTVARSSFFDLCCTNLELDAELVTGGTIRSKYLGRTDWTNPIDGLGNGFSVNFLVTTRDHQLLLTKRTAKGLTTYPDAWMVSVGGYMMNGDLSRIEDERYRSPFRTAVREASRELRLDLDELGVAIHFTSLTVDTRLSAWYLLGKAALPLTAAELGRSIGVGTLETEFYAVKFLPLDPEAVLDWMTREPGAWVPGALVCLYHLLESSVGRAALEGAIKRRHSDLEKSVQAIYPWPTLVSLTEIQQR